MAEHTLTVAEAERSFHALVERARRFHESTLLTENGEPVALVVPAPVNESTAHRLADWWHSRPRLGVGEAEAFEEDLIESRSSRWGGFLKSRGLACGSSLSATPNQTGSS